METPRMVSPVSHVINVQKVLHVPMKCWMQLLTTNKFILFYWGRGVRERWYVAHRSPLPGVGKPAMVVVRVQGASVNQKKSRVVAQHIRGVTARIEELPAQFSEANMQARVQKKPTHDLIGLRVFTNGGVGTEKLNEFGYRERVLPWHVEKHAVLRKVARYSLLYLLA